MHKTLGAVGIDGAYVVLRVGRQRARLQDFGVGTRRRHLFGPAQRHAERRALPVFRAGPRDARQRSFDALGVRGRRRPGNETRLRDEAGLTRLYVRNHDGSTRYGATGEGRSGGIEILNR